MCMIPSPFAPSAVNADIRCDEFVLNWRQGRVPAADHDDNAGCVYPLRPARLPDGLDELDERGDERGQAAVCDLTRAADTRLAR